MQSNKHPRDSEWVNSMLNQLKVLAMIDIGDKVCTEYPMFYVQASGLQQSVIRHATGESRQRNMKRIAEVVQSIMDHIEDAYQQSNGELRPENSIHTNMSTLHVQQYTQQFIGALANAQHGLRNLVYAYTHDKMITAQIDTIIENIDSFIQRCSRLGVPHTLIGNPPKASNTEFKIGTQLKTKMFELEYIPGQNE